jgi:hypothetical protein
MNRTRTFITVLAAALLLCGAGRAAAEISLVANHDHITIDFFYHGSSVSARGLVEPGTDVIVKIAGPEGTETLKQKGRTAGVLWMNVGTLHFEKTPNLYEIYSTRPIDQILTPEEAEREVIGYGALSKHLELEPVASPEDREKWVGVHQGSRRTRSSTAARPAASRRAERAAGGATSRPTGPSRRLPGTTL